jgi:hypothetical protein
MGDKTEQFDKNNSPEFSDDAIRRFFFGRLSPAGQAALEERLFTDDSFEARGRLAEFDLADDYALERLNAADREAFEKKFLLSAERERQLRVSTALRDRFASAPTVATTAKGAKASTVERLRLLLGLNQRAWRFAFGVAILAILVAAAWLVLKQSRPGRTINPPPIVRSWPSPNPRRETAHPHDPSSPPEHHITPSPMPPHEPTASPVILSVDLFRDTSRERHTIRLIDLPKGEHDIVRLQLALKLNQTRSYRADLLTVEGQSIFSSQSLQSTDTDAGKVDFDVPTALLKTGDYRVSLRRADDGSKKTGASYYFRVR